MSNQSFLGLPVGRPVGKPIAPGQGEAAIPGSGNPGGFDLKRASAVPAAQLTPSVPPSIAGVPATGSLVGAAPASQARAVGTAGGSPARNLGDLYTQTSENQAKLESWKTAYAAFFPEGSA